MNIRKKFLVFDLILFCLLLTIFANFSFAQKVNLPDKTEEVEGIILKIAKAILEFLKKVWQNLLNFLFRFWSFIKDVWQNYIFPFLEKIWQKVIKKEIEERKPIIKEELKKEKQEIKEEIKTKLPTGKSLWEKFKELIK